MQDRRIEGYPFDEVRKREELVLRTYEYDMPFNYENVTVWRKECRGGEFHGVELLTRNTISSVAKLTRVNPGEWTLMQVAFTAPPEAAAAEFRVDIDSTGEEGSLFIADAFAGVVPASFEDYHDIPVETKNLLENPSFSGEDVVAPKKSVMAADFVRGWKIDQGLEAAEMAAYREGRHSGLKLTSVQISLCSEVAVRPGQRLVYALRAKSANRFPQCVQLFPRWKNSQSICISDNAGDSIIIEEDKPIVRVAVIGSACTPPGYVMLEAVPCDDFYRRGDYVRSTAPVRFKQSNLWGMHLRCDQWGIPADHGYSYEDIPEAIIRRYPGMKDVAVKAHYSEFPFTGMSCAVFEIPRSQKVIIMGGSDNVGWLSDSFPDDDHYSFRTVRVTVADVM